MKVHIVVACILVCLSGCGVHEFETTEWDRVVDSIKHQVSGCVVLKEGGEWLVDTVHLRGCLNGGSVVYGAKNQVLAVEIKKVGDRRLWLSLQGFPDYAEIQITEGLNEALKEWYQVEFGNPVEIIR